MAKDKIKKNKYDDNNDAPIKSSLSLLFMLVIPIAGIFTMSNVPFLVIAISYLIGLVLLVYSKVKYPTNKFTKGVFVFGMISLAFVIFLIQLVETCMSCPG